MDAETFWDQLAFALGLPKDTLTSIMTTALKAAIVALVTIWFGGWLRARIQRAAGARYALADVASLVSRAVAFVVYGIGATIALSVLGVNPTAITTVIAAATIGSTLAMQDVARGFVNGLYILVERPYRIGDRVRIGATEGRVEEIGVVLTKMRNDDGEQTIVPNAIVLSNIVETIAAGQVDRRQYTVTGMNRPPTEIVGAVTRALQGVPHLSPRAPTVDFIAAGPDGISASITVRQDLGHRVDDLVITRLREAFPEATVTIAATTDPS